MTRTATCSCGRLKIVVTGEPRYAGLCSCLQCQRRSGSAFGYNSYWPRTNVVAVEGVHATWRRGSDAGRGIDFHFCATCGATVFWDVDYDPDLAAVAVGNFADPAFPPPQYAEWGVSRHPWVQVPDGCRQKPGQ